MGRFIPIHPIRERIAILNHPSAPHATTWNSNAVNRLVELGFTSVQVNIAWGWRPADEPLNLEDVVSLSPDDARTHPQPLGLRSNPLRFEERRQELTRRISLCRQAGLRTIFHFGAPFNQHAMHGGAPPNCIKDESVIERYELLLGQFHREFGTDDLWLYTYDQDAWLCSEFGACPRCQGIPLHLRLAPFLERLTARWRALNPEGRMWWEPWELSAGQILKVVEGVAPSNFGLALHNNVAECMVAFAGDRHVTNFARLAKDRGIPVTIEGYFGAASEELEPYQALQSPLTTFRQVKAMMSIDGVTGLKEYYGVDISKEDPNLRAASICFLDPTISEDELLVRLSAGYGDQAARAAVQRVWCLASEAMELYPWDVSWFAREIGRSDPSHSLNAAFLRGWSAETPAWRSTRGATFMVIDESEPHPWLLEDVQLRWELCAARQREALEVGIDVAGKLPGVEGAAFRAFIDELREFHRRVLAYAHHCRETNLATLLRRALDEHEDPPTRVVQELLDVMEADRKNVEAGDQVIHPRLPAGREHLLDANSSDRRSLTTAIEALRRDPVEFAAAYFIPTTASEHSYGRMDGAIRLTTFDSPRGPFSVTSR